MARVEPAEGLKLPFDWHLDDDRGKPAPAASGAPDQVVALDHDETGLMISWGDGEVQRIDPRDLRLACQCASCRDEISGKRKLDPALVPLDVAPVRIWSVGNYALGIGFSDGHQSGIYSFDLLREMSAAEVEDV